MKEDKPITIVRPITTDDIFPTPKGGEKRAIRNYTQAIETFNKAIEERKKEIEILSYNIEICFDFIQSLKKRLKENEQ